MHVCVCVCVGLLYIKLEALFGISLQLAVDCRENEILYKRRRDDTDHPRLSGMKSRVLDYRVTEIKDPVLRDGIVAEVCVTGEMVMTFANKLFSE